MASVGNPIIWVHGDCLNPDSPAFQNHPQVPAIWVWDDAYLQRAGISLKRILFIYECLLDLPVSIRRGNVATEIAAFARAQQTHTIVTVNSPSPGFARLCHQLQIMGFDVHPYEPEPFVTIPEPVDLRRFSRYWRAAQSQLKRDKV